MPTAIFPSPLPIQGAVVASNRIAVTHVVEQTSEKIRFDIHELICIPVTDEPWNSCFVPTDQIEPETSDWGQILSVSAPGTYVIGKSSDGKFYEVAVCSSYFPWLVSHEFEFRAILNHHVRTQWFPLCVLQSSKSFLVGASAAALSAMHALICRIQFFFPPALWYDFWTVVSGVMLYASIFRYLESSSACKIILFSTCGEFSALLKCVHVRHRPQQPDPWFLLACASLSFLKLTLTCGLFFVGWSELIGIGGVLAFSALIICGFQAALSQNYRVIAQSVEHDSSVIKVRDLETAPDADMESEVHNSRLGRQHLRKDSLAALHSEFDYMSCTLARLSNLGTHKEEEISTKLNEVGRLYGVFSALELPDESMEMVTLKSCIPELQYRLGEIFPGCHFDPIYDPTEPSREDVERLYVAAKNSTLPAESGEMIEDVKWCHTAAKVLRIDASSSRARAMIKEGPRTVAAAYYSCFLERNVTWLKENASYDRIEAECCGQFESGVGGVSYLFLLANDGELFSRGKTSA